MSEEECRHTYRRGDYYVIAPMLPELRRDDPVDVPPLNAEYSSADSPVDLTTTVALLQKNRLMLGQTEVPAAELLR